MRTSTKFKIAAGVVAFFVLCATVPGGFIVAGIHIFGLVGLWRMSSKSTAAWRLANLDVCKAKS